MSEDKRITIVVAGPRGKMGSETIGMIGKTPHFKLVGVLDRLHDGKMLSDLEGFTESDVPVYTDADRCFSALEPDVLIDFTHPAVGKEHMKKALEYGVRPVIGTSGFTERDVTRLKAMADEKGIGAIIAPNFAIGAVLMMKFSQMAARHFPDVEIIEQHGDQKRDAPSGTAVKTAEMIQKTRTAKKQGPKEENEMIPRARGAEFDGFRIHSVRLPGLVAHQQVLFGGNGELLTIRHDSFNRESFMSGVRYAADTVMTLDTLVYGLENLLE